MYDLPILGRKRAKGACRNESRFCKRSIVELLLPAGPQLWNPHYSHPLFACPISRNRGLKGFCPQIWCGIDLTVCRALSQTWKPTSSVRVVAHTRGVVEATVTHRSPVHLAKGFRHCPLRS